MKFLICIGSKLGKVMADSNAISFLRLTEKAVLLFRICSHSRLSPHFQNWLTV